LQEFLEQWFFHLLAFQDANCFKAARHTDCFTVFSTER
jgi:hypothetical protein